MNIERVNSVFDNISSVLERARCGQVPREGLYICLLKAAFAKSFEFNRLVFRKDHSADPFALTPSLRGLCEDVIGLKFIGRFSSADRDEAVLLLTNEQTNDFIQKQHDFFWPIAPRRESLETTIWMLMPTQVSNRGESAKSSGNSEEHTAGLHAGIGQRCAKWLKQVDSPPFTTISTQLRRVLCTFRRGILPGWDGGTLRT